MAVHKALMHRLKTFLDKTKRSHELTLAALLLLISTWFLFDMTSDLNEALSLSDTRTGMGDPVQYHTLARAHYMTLMIRLTPAYAIATALLFTVGFALWIRHFSKDGWSIQLRRLCWSASLLFIPSALILALLFKDQPQWICVAVGVVWALCLGATAWRALHRLSFIFLIILLSPVLKVFIMGKLYAYNSIPNTGDPARVFIIMFSIWIILLSSQIIWGAFTPFFERTMLISAVTMFVFMIGMKGHTDHELAHYYTHASYTSPMCGQSRPQLMQRLDADYKDPGSEITRRGGRQYFFGRYARDLGRAVNF